MQVADLVLPTQKLICMLLSHRGENAEST